ncbi:MAG TPA: SHOCT domain-containing protein [Candidatus Deferrimicrobium sp.]|nr:SHOCT domain-containing protein [Candidatus Deferrimicrobium sp.]
MMMGRWGGGPGFNGGHILGGMPLVGIICMLLILLFWGAVIVLAIKFVRNKNLKGFMSAPAEDSALTILRERFAKGEIDAEEFLKRKEALLIR